jgi:hypothetical protein
MSIYASSPDMRPDDEFEPGTLQHLVVGVQGRLLDPRRTPVSVIEVRPTTGFVFIRIEGFEDEGAIWQVPLEEVTHYQFEGGGRRAPAMRVAQMEAAIERFARDQVIEAAEPERARTQARIRERQAEATTWLATHSRFLAEEQPLPAPSTRRGDPMLSADLEAYLQWSGLRDVEGAFAQGYVSNPGSGEIIKGHRIVLAELGLVAYVGLIVRDPATFSGLWARERRADHIIARLAFVRSLFHLMDMAHVTLWRGLSADGPLRTDTPRTFVSTSFDEAVARSHFETAGRPTHVITRQKVPVERLFMTYLETGAMNDRFLEAEAVVLAQPDDGWA